ncbi:MAG: hypothetical protein WAV30_04690 [Microgenomates group bacterium]
MLTYLRMCVKKVNLYFSSVILTIFYLLIIPLGKLIYLIATHREKKDGGSFWREKKYQIDPNSPY